MLHLRGEPPAGMTGHRVRALAGCPLTKGPRGWPVTVQSPRAWPFIMQSPRAWPFIMQSPRK